MCLILPFEVYQQDIDKSVRECDVVGHYGHQSSELEIDIIRSSHSGSGTTFYIGYLIGKISQLSSSSWGWNVNQEAMPGLNSTIKTMWVYRSTPFFNCGVAQQLEFFTRPAVNIAVNKIDI